MCIYINRLSNSPGKSGNVHWDVWKLTSLQLGTISCVHLSHTIPNKTMENEMAAKERGRLHTNSLAEIRSWRSTPIRSRVRDRSAKLLEMNDSEYVSLSDSSFCDGVTIPPWRECRCWRCDRDDDLPLFFDLVRRLLLLLLQSRLVSDVSSSDESVG